MVITIELNTDNTAFENDFEGELSAVMRRAEAQIRGEALVVRLRGYSFPEVFNLYDTDGNNIGTVRLHLR